MILDHEYFMKEALKEAEKAFNSGDVPVGVVITINNKIIARAHNQVEMLSDATAHAEMLALTSAMNKLGSKYLNECNLYVTLEPCPMCAGALSLSRVQQLIYGADDEKGGYRLFSDKILHPKTKVRTGILSQESLLLLQDFFRKKRN